MEKLIVVFGPLLPRPMKSAAAGYVRAVDVRQTSTNGAAKMTLNFSILNFLLPGSGGLPRRPLGASPVAKRWKNKLVGPFWQPPQPETKIDRKS